jgi:hypothetical protein
MQGFSESPGQYQEQIQAETASLKDHTSSPEHNDQLIQLYGKRKAIEWMLHNRGKDTRETYEQELIDLKKEIANEYGSDEGYVEYLAQQNTSSLH